jgi:NAD(P)-dependent dehydrogenase (short-subunit alcohol dehydrogenase family)
VSARLRGKIALVNGAARGIGQATECRRGELDPLHLDVIIRRHEAATGKPAGLVETGEIARSV